MHFADGFSSKIFMMIFYLTSWRPCVTLVTSLNNFRPASLKISRCSSTNSNYRSKTATIKKQYHINREKLQRKTAQFLSNDGAISTVSEDVDADLFYDEAANSLLTSGLFDYDNSHLQHLTTDGSQITDYWIHKLSQLPVGAAKTLISQIVPDNSVGYVGLTGPAKSNTLVAYYIDQKLSHPDKIILMRNGEFYETFGIDSLMLIAYAGLNPMGGKAKAGCPIQNVQATLDGLTRQGFSIAVYEESPITQDEDSGVKKRIKARYLSQIVFPGAKTYTHNLSLRQDNIDFQENSPVIGIMKTAGGYMMIEVYLDEEIIEVSERLTLETVRVLAKGGFVQPVYLNGDVKKDILGDDVRYEILSGYSETDFADQVLRKFSINDLSTAKVSSFKKRRKSYLNGPRPVYISTALQIGRYTNIEFLSYNIIFDISRLFVDSLSD